MVNGKRVMSLRECESLELARGVANLLHQTIDNSVFIAAFETADKKACVLLMYSDDMVAAGHDAAKDIREIAHLIQGGGGGQKFLANAGGKNPAGLHEAYETLVELATR